MKKLIAESLPEYLNEDLASDINDLRNKYPDFDEETGDIKGHEKYKGEIDALRNKYSQSNAPTAEEFEEFVQELCDLDDPNEAKKQLLDLFGKYPEMHEETGDIKGHEKYKKGLDTFRACYGGVRESLNEEQLNESLKGSIDKFMQSPTDEKQANALLSQSFAKQFSVQQQTKKYVLSLSFDDKKKLLQQCSQKLADSKIGILKLFKNKEGKLVVGGTPVSGGARQSIKG
jgi:hypothetical protein